MYRLASICRQYLCFASILFFCFSTGLASADEQAFHINAQPLAKALIKFSDLTHIVVIAPSSLVQGIQASAVIGTMTPEQALEKLLSESGLDYVKEKKGYVITRKEGALQFHSIDATSRPEFVFEEIIVTATKRAERLQDVPASIGVVSADDISWRGLVNAEDYLRGMPGVSQLGGDGKHGGQAIIIRGIETNTFAQNFNSGPTTATYFGETPTTNSGGVVGSSVDIKLVDIERVEVLRGPQGTAFGSSSLGGAVRTIPVAPQLDLLEGEVAVGYSVTSDSGGGNYMLQAIGNLPLIEDKLAIRATAYKFSNSGYYRNRAGSDATVQEEAVVPLGLEAFAVDEKEVGDHDAGGGRVAALFQVNDELKFTLSYLTQKDQTDGWATASSGPDPYDQITFRVAPEHGGKSGGFIDHKIRIANVVMEYDFGWADLLATYSYVKGEQRQARPYGAGGPFASFSSEWAVSFDQELLHREDAGEIRLVTKLDGAWNFLAGLYAEKLDDLYDSASGGLGILWYGDQAANFFGQRDWSDYFEQRDLTQRAVFGEVSWEFLPGFTLTGGARAYEYERGLQADQDGPLLGGPSSRHEETEESDTLYRVNLSHKPNDDTLFYAGWSQGFRLGKTQPAPPSAICDVDSNGIVDGTGISLESAGQVSSDTVDNYELGGKFAFMDRQLQIDATLFYIDWSGIPVNFYAPQPCGWSILINAGTARSEGVELQADFQVTDSLGATFGGSWTHARLTKDVPSVGFSADDRLPGSPKVNASLGLHYSFDLVGYAAFARADVIYVGPFHTDVTVRSEGTEAGDYAKLDVTTRVRIDNFNVDLFVRNLTNENAFTSRVGAGDLGKFVGHRLRPRTIGVNLSSEF